MEISIFNKKVSIIGKNYISLQIEHFNRYTLNENQFIEFKKGVESINTSTCEGMTRYK